MRDCRADTHDHEARMAPSSVFQTTQRKQYRAVETAEWDSVKYGVSFLGSYSFTVPLSLSMLLLFDHSVGAVESANESIAYRL